MKKKFFSLILALALVFGMLPTFSFEVDAAEYISYNAIADGLQNLKNKLCTGTIKYWNANLSKKQMQAIADNGTLDLSNPTNAQLGVTTSGCGSNCTSNYYDGWQCFGFARWVQYVLFGSAVSDSSNFNTYTITSSNASTFELQAGDLLEVGTGNVHSAIIASVSDKTFECLEAWGNAGCRINYSTGGFNNSNNTLTKVLNRYPDYVVRVYRYKYIADYFSECSELYPSFSSAVVKNNCNPHPLPCSDTVAQKYGYSSPAMTDKALSPGDYIMVNGIIMNTEGHYWYKVTLSDGTVAYVFANECEYDGDFQPYLTGDVLPDNINGSTFLGGKVEAPGARINSVQAIVYKGSNLSGDAIIESDIDYVSTTTGYNLYKSDVDYSMPFQDLANYGAGYYSILIRVNITSYYLTNNYELKVSERTVTAGWDNFTYGSPGTCSHSYSKAVTEPTCTEQGYTVYTCTKCGDTYVGDYVDATDHAYGDWVTVAAPTCTTDGELVRTCVRCGAQDTETAFATGHSYAAQYVAATCLNAAYTHYTCTNCGDSYIVYDDSDAGWSTEKPAGVDESLIETRTEYRYQTKNFATGTSETMDGWILYDIGSQWGEYGDWSGWSDTAITADDATKVETRTVYGYYYFLCPNCGAHMHGYGSCYTWAGGCGATTTSSGWHAVWSTVSWDDAGLKDWYGTGKYYTYIDGELVFKWTDGGSKVQYRSCTREKHSIYYFYQWSEWSDWSTVGVYENENCNVETRTVYRTVTDGLGEHDYVPTGVIAPTCTEQGYTIYTCSVCGDSYRGNYIDAIAHSYGYAVTDAPTFDTTGMLTGTCANCFDTVTVDLPRLNAADYSYTVIQEPSSTSTGTGRYVWNDTTYGTFYFDVVLDKLTVSLDRIEIAAAPEKTVYEIGESLDTTGLTLKAIYSDGTVETVTDGFTVSGFDSSSAGVKTVTVFYLGKTAAFTVTVNPSAISTDPQIVVSVENGTVGQQVEVTISLRNNPGVASMQLTVNYDTDVLTLVGVADSGNLGAAMHSDNMSACPYTLSWVNDLATTDYTYNGVIVTLTFLIAADAKPGESMVTVTYNYDNFEIYNAEGEEVWFATVSGYVDVADFILGDVNGDGKVNAEDRLLLTRYLAKWEGYTEDMINMNAADVNCDGKVNAQDRMILTRYLAKWTGYENLGG